MGSRVSHINISLWEDKVTIMHSVHESQLEREETEQVEPRFSAYQPSALQLLN